MHKLIILVKSTENDLNVETEWFRFLNWAEKMPGLRREVTSRRTLQMYGDYPCLFIHELFFDNKGAAETALASEAGQNAGKTLQEITGGHITLFLAEHLEDTLQNIQSYTPHPNLEEEEEDDAAEEEA
jgi:hypothetical protein